MNNLCPCFIDQNKVFPYMILNERKDEIGVYPGIVYCIG